MLDNTGEEDVRFCGKRIGSFPMFYAKDVEGLIMARRYRPPEENARREKIRELLQMANIGNMVLNVEIILRASLLRTESRGWHFREDYPQEDDSKWLAWGRLWRDKNGQMVQDKVEVPEEWRPQKPYHYPKRWLAWEQWPQPAEREEV